MKKTQLKPPYKTRPNSAARRSSKQIQTEKNNKVKEKEVLRYLLSLNQTYFQKKATIDEDCSPRQRKPIIPSNTGNSTNRTEYISKLPFGQSLRLTKDLDLKTINRGFLSQRTTSTDYCQTSIPKRQKLTPQDCIKSNDGPLVIKSQYKNNYLNWGPSHPQISMNPGNHSAVTNLPFKDSTTYKEQFSHKQNHEKTQSAKPGKKLPIMGYHSCIKLLSSTNAYFHDKKKMPAKNNPKKPRSSNAISCEANFKGNTEYKTEYLKKDKSMVSQANRQFLTMAQIQQILLK